MTLAAAFLFGLATQAQAARPAGRGDGNLPTLGQFAGWVINGQPGVVRGVYVPSLMALRVEQHPPGDRLYVSSEPFTATPYRAAALEGVMGLFAHSTAAAR